MQRYDRDMMMEEDIESAQAAVTSNVAHHFV